VFYLGVMLPLWSSYLVKVYAWKLILAKEGILTWVFDKLHLTFLIDAWLTLPVVGGNSLSLSLTGTFSGLRLCLAAVHDPACAGSARAGARQSA
jgi:putative spermidine/putrescine transport system permease protein